MARIPGNAEATTTRALYARSRGVTPASRQPRRRRLTKRSELAEQRDPHEARREQALLQATTARIVLVRKKAEELKDALIQRDQSQGEVTAAAVEVIEQLAAAALPEEIREVLAADLDGLEVQALLVTR